MNRSTLILIVAIIGLLFGLGFLADPNMVMGFYGSKLDLTGEFLARFFGSALLGLEVILFTGGKAKILKEIVKSGLLGGLVLGVTDLMWRYRTASPEHLSLLSGLTQLSA